MADAYRNLVLCFDGTGNVWKPGPHKTNVVKLVQALIDEPEHQLCYYDPGVGTPDGLVPEGLAWRDFIARLSGLVWGGGVWRNVAAGYAFIMRNYRPGDRIFLFGFSRGAFTARAVAGMIDMFGLLRAEHENLIPTLISVYKSRHVDAEGKDTGASIRARFSRTDADVDVHFTGVWDTVESVGLSQILLGTNITTTPVVKPSYRHVRHALALDEKRWPYEPRQYYPRRHRPDDTFLQVGFTGAHSDIGGGYAESGLANESLHWMVREAYAYGLLVDLDRIDAYEANPYDLCHDESTAQPFWCVAGAFDRALPETLFLHESVLLRACRQLGIEVPVQLGKRVAHTRLMLRAPGADQPVQRKLPRAPAAAPIRVVPGFVQWAWLIVLGAIVAALACWNHALQFELATLQFINGFTGNLAERLVTFDHTAAPGVIALLCADTALILAYALWLPVLQMFLLRLSARDGAAAPWLGKMFCYSAGFLPLFDIAENYLTLKVWRHAGAVPGQCLCFISDAVLPRLVAVSSLAKFIAGIFVAISVIACIAKAFTRNREGLTAEKIVERCTAPSEPTSGPDAQGKV